MNRAATAVIVRAARAAGLRIPADDIEITVDVWAAILTDVPLADAQHAVVHLAQAGDGFLTPRHIRDHVRRVRRDRLERAGDLAPNADPDDQEAWLGELRALRKAVADGMPADQLAQYRAGGVSLTGSHHALAITAGPVDPVEVHAGQRALARITQSTHRTRPVAPQTR